MAALIALLLLAPPPKGAGEPDICRLMSGAETQLAVSGFEEAVAQAAKEQYAAALSRFQAVSDKLHGDAEALFLSGEQETTADGTSRRSYLDRFVVPDNGPLTVRKDRFSLRLPVLRYGAWLACKAGDRDAGEALLRGGWRDFGEGGLLTDAGFLLSVSGLSEKAARFVAEAPASGPELALAGLVACRAGRRAEAVERLDQAAAASAVSPAQKEQLALLRQRCRP